MRAKDIGCERFIFLIADEEITNIEDVYKWKVSTRKNGIKYTQVKPETLQKIMCTMRDKYNCEFLFCKKDDMGKKIIELLS